LADGFRPIRPQVNPMTQGLGICMFMLWTIRSFT
jgi:hypothetical protein